MKYLIIIEKDGKGCSAYVPDLPGCVAAGDTEEEVRETYPGGHPVTSQGHARDWRSHSGTYEHRRVRRSCFMT